MSPGLTWALLALLAITCLAVVLLAHLLTPPPPAPPQLRLVDELDPEVDRLDPEGNQAAVNAAIKLAARVQDPRRPR